MDYQRIINELSRNQQVFRELLENIPQELILWKPARDKWCLLEIVCHLLDEEREDFRARLKHVLETPEKPMIPYDPLKLVTERDYIGQNYEVSLKTFLNARMESIEWLQSLISPSWNNTYRHPKLGPMTAKLFLSNWLAHDYIHIRQILKVKFAFLEEDSEESLSYAGNW